MASNIVVEAGLIIAIAILAWRSQKHDGFADVKYDPVTSLSGISWEKLARSQFRWTLVPALIMSVVGICFSTMVSATAERQPYIELNHHNGEAKNVKLTILLDYPSCALFYSWFVALKNHHFLLAFSLLVQLAVSVSLVSLTGNLFRADDSHTSLPVHLESLVDLNVSSLTLGTDLQPAIELASAIHAYGAAPPTWMTANYSIEPFSSTLQEVTGNISVYTSVYSAKLDCRVIDRSDLNITFTPADVSSLGEEQISFTDRGCNVTDQGFIVSSDDSTYALSWYQNCAEIPIGSNWNDRLGVFFGLYSDIDPEKLTNFITISCIPSYQNASALVTMSFAANSQPKVVSINPKETAEMVNENFEDIHSTLYTYRYFDPSGTYKSDPFARAVHTVTQKLSGSSILGPESALNATKVVYETLFAALAETQLMHPLESPRVMTGDLAAANTRLYVVIPIACAELAILFPMLVCSIGLLIYAYEFTSILHEDPVGLLGKAVVLLGSDIFGFISSVLEANSEGTKVVKLVRKKYAIKKSTCYFDQDQGEASMTVHVKDVRRKPVQPPSRIVRMKTWLSKKWWPRRERPPIRTSPAINTAVTAQGRVANTNSVSAPSGSSAQANTPAVSLAQTSDHIEMTTHGPTLDGRLGRDTPDYLPLLSRNQTV